MTEVSRKICLLDIPYEILFEIFRILPKSKLYEISRICSKLRNVAGDTRLWKDVYITYEENVVAFEELYSEPWPVKVIDLQGKKIKPPVSSKTDQVIKVNRLELSSIKANKLTIEAILAKYQCKQLQLDMNELDRQGHIIGIAPEVFSNQTDLEMLTLVNIFRYIDLKSEEMTQHSCQLWLAPVLNNCRNLKILSLNYNYMHNHDMLGFVTNLPTSLEKLSLVHNFPEDSFFNLLAGSTPNLRELALDFRIIEKCPSLINIQFLECLCVLSESSQDTSDLYMYLIKFPALRSVHVMGNKRLENLSTKLEPRGIIVRPITYSEELPQDGNSWKVSKAT